MAYFGTSAIYIRRYDANFDSWDLNSDYTPCANILVNLNTFKQNFGCPLYGGSLISLHCQSEVNKDQTLDQPQSVEVSESQREAVKGFDFQDVSVDGSTTNKLKIEFSDNYYEENYGSYN